MNSWKYSLIALFGHMSCNGWFHIPLSCFSYSRLDFTQQVQANVIEVRLYLGEYVSPNIFRDHRGETIDWIRRIRCKMQKWYESPLSPRGYDGDRPKHTGGFCFIRSTPSSRSNKVGLKCPSARPFVHKKFFDFSEIGYLGRGRRVMHDGMQYDPIQGHGKARSRAHESWKFNHFRRLSPPPFITGLANHHGFLN